MYHMILGKKSLNIGARVCVHVCVRACVLCMCVCVCACVCVHVCVHACVCVWEGRSSTSHIALYVNLNEAVACTCQNHLRFHLYNF